MPKFNNGNIYQEYNSQSISATLVMDTTSSQMQILNGGAADRDVQLPTGSSVLGVVYVIINSGSTNVLNVKPNGGGSTITSISPGNSGSFSYSGSAWNEVAGSAISGFSGYSGYSGSGSSSKLKRDIDGAVLFKQVSGGPLAASGAVSATATRQFADVAFMKIPKFQWEMQPLDTGTGISGGFSIFLRNFGQVTGTLFNTWTASNLAADGTGAAATVTGILTPVLPIGNAQAGAMVVGQNAGAATLSIDAGGNANAILFCTATTITQVDRNDIDLG
ncbi:MAG: hypothetical protein ACOCUD_03490 [Bacillota bacterium]